MIIIKDVLTEDLNPIGMTDNNMIGLSPSDRVGIMHIFGAPGQGKTFALATMAISDIVHGRGGVLIDPYGDLADKILDHVPSDRKTKVVVFDLEEGDLASNIERFEKEIHLSEVRSDDQKFLLCKLHGMKLGEDVPCAFGQYLLGKFFEVVGEDQNLSNRALYLDEAYNYLDESNLDRVLQSKSLGLRTVLSDQSKKGYINETLKQLAVATDHLLSYKTDDETQKFISENYHLDVSAEDIGALEKYHHYASLIVNGERQPTTIMQGVHPIPFPETK